jgi:hypothetical protein
MMQDDLVTRLAGVTALAAIQGANVGWFERAARFGYPATVLQLVLPGREYTHEGPDGLDGPRIQFDFYGLDPDVLHQLAQLTLAEMEQAADVGATRFHPATLERHRTGQSELTADNKRLFRIEMDFEFYYEPI